LPTPQIASRDTSSDAAAISRAVSSSLLEHRPAGFAEAGLLPPQAGVIARIRDLAWTKAIDVGCSLFVPALLVQLTRSGCDQCERQQDGAACDPRIWQILLSLNNPDAFGGWCGAVFIRANNQKFLPTVIFHTFGHHRAGLPSSEIRQR
jgi:hypothetical protein